MIGMLSNITYSEYHLHMTYLHPIPFGGVIGFGGYVAVQRCQVPRNYLRDRYLKKGSSLFATAYGRVLCISNINSRAARVNVAPAYLEDVMQDSACPSRLDKNRSFSRGVTYAKQREVSRIGFSCEGLNFKTTEIVGQTSTTKTAHASWKMDFSILISTRVTVTYFLSVFVVAVELHWAIGFLS